MKKIVFSILAAIVAVSASAKDSTRVKMTPEQKANKQADRLKTELSLSDDQRNKTYSAILDRIHKVDAIKAKYKDSANRKGMGKEIQSVKSEFDNTLATFLTGEQMTKYKELEKKKKDRMKAHRKEKKGKHNDSDDDSDDDN